MNKNQSTIIQIKNNKMIVISVVKNKIILIKCKIVVNIMDIITKIK